MRSSAQDSLRRSGEIVFSGPRPAAPFQVGGLTDDSGGDRTRQTIAIDVVEAPLDPWTPR